MIRRAVALLTSLVCTSACAPEVASVTPTTAPARARDVASATDTVNRLLDDWHAAAARADEEAYFSAFARGGVFLGTDATERWDVAAFRAYAHPRFAVGKSWRFKSTRRTLQFSPSGEVAWFEEDLDTPNLGPARGSGVVVLEDGAYKIAQYNLSVPIPNERFEAVRRAISAP